MGRIRSLAIALSVTGITMVSTAAMAAKPYADETCHVVVKHGRKVDFYSDNSQSAFIVRNDREDLPLDALYVHKRGSPNELPSGREDLIVEVVSDAKILKHKYADGCFSGQIAAYKRKAFVSHASRLASRELGLHKGQKIQLECRAESIVAADSCSASAVPSIGRD